MTLPTHPLDVQRLLRDWRTSMDSTEWTAAGDRVVSRECAPPVPERGHRPNPGSQRRIGSPSPAAVGSGRRALTVNGPTDHAWRQGRTLLSWLWG